MHVHIYSESYTALEIYVVVSVGGRNKTDDVDHKCHKIILCPLCPIRKTLFGDYPNKLRVSKWNAWNPLSSKEIAQSRFWVYIECSPDVMVESVGGAGLQKVSFISIRWRFVRSCLNLVYWRLQSREVGRPTWPPTSHKSHIARDNHTLLKKEVGFP